MRKLNLNVVFMKFIVVLLTANLIGEKAEASDNWCVPATDLYTLPVFVAVDSVVNIGNVVTEETPNYLRKVSEIKEAEANSFLEPALFTKMESHHHAERPQPLTSSSSLDERKKDLLSEIGRLLANGYHYDDHKKKLSQKSVAERLGINSVTLSKRWHSYNAKTRKYETKKRKRWPFRALNADATKIATLKEFNDDPRKLEALEWEQKYRLLHLAGFLTKLQR